MKWLEILKGDVAWVFDEMDAGAHPDYMRHYVAKNLKDETDNKYPFCIDKAKSE